jgi:hypothetical protein
VTDQYRWPVVIDRYEQLYDNWTGGADSRPLATIPQREPAVND